MSGHGHVTPNADGSKARCGGPGICRDCALEQVAVLTAAAEPEITKTSLDSLSDLVAAFDRARGLEAEAKEKKEEYRTLIAAYLESQNAEYGTIGGKLRIRWREIKQKKWNGKKFKEAHPKLAEEFTDDSSYMKMEVID